MLQGIIACSKTFINTATENIVINVNVVYYQQNLTSPHVLFVQGTDEQKDENENETKEDKVKPTGIKILLI